MDEDFCKEQTQRIRALAERADPFTRRRLLALVGRYAPSRSLERRGTAAAGARHAAGVDPLGVGRGVTMGAIEVRRDACGGAGSLPARRLDQT